MASSVASRSLKSGTLAPETTTESGPPSASTRTERLTPFLALSVGLGPMRSPQNEPYPSHRRLPATPIRRPRARRTPRPEPPRFDPALQALSIAASLEGSMHAGVVRELCG